MASWSITGVNENRFRPSSTERERLRSLHGIPDASVVFLFLGRLNRDKGVLDLLGIGPETPLSISTDGNCLIVSPVRSAKKRAEFEQSLNKVNQRHTRALKRLAE